MSKHLRDTQESRSSGTSPLRQKYRALTRQRLLETSAKIFLERGYADATISEIVAAAEIGRATFYLHFRNKIDVMRAIVRDAAARNEQLIQEFGDIESLDRSKLKEWITKFIVQLAGDRHIFLVGLQAMASEPEIASEVESGVNAGQTILADLLSTRCNLPPNEAKLRALLLINGLQRAIHAFVIEPKEYSLELVIDVLTQMWAAALLA